MTGLAGIRAIAGGMPRWAWFAIGGALLLFAFYIALDAYGDSRYDKGKADADAAWVEAGNKLVQRAQNAAGKADKESAARIADFTARQEDEKEKIEHAQQTGASPFDVLFGAGNAS